MKFKEYIKEGGMMAAYFISPNGEIIYAPVTHINTIIRHPKKFGLNSEFIEHIYDFYGEKIGQEGKAREQILISLLNKGWIRLRRYRNFWSVNVVNFSSKIKSYLQKWANMLLKGKLEFDENDPYIDIKIDPGGKIISSDIRKIAGIKEDKSFKLEFKNIEEMEDLPLYDFVNEFMKEGK